MNLAVLTLIGLQVAMPASPAPPCGCAPFAPAARQAAPDSQPLSADARTLRDFALYAHRRIAEDLIRGRGPYLDTLLARFRGCSDRGAVVAWLRQLLASTSDTGEFAERIARQVDSASALPAACGRTEA